MNLDDVVRTVAEKGFTERQARFLVFVARHSGVCVMRQYSTFAGIVFGQKTRKFFAKLERLGYVSTYDCAHNRGASTICATVSCTKRSASLTAASADRRLCPARSSV
jgi:hypothetical protein